MEIPRLHPETIEQVKQRVDIVDVVSEHVVLRKQGKDFTGLCPFHDDKSPSFTVSPSKQFYYCFSCGAGGNAFKFLMELGKRSFSDVVLELARRYQVSVQTLKPEERQEFQRQLSLREQLYEILAITSRFFEHALYQSQGKGALKYLETQRHLSRATMQQFQLGYAPAGWETLHGYLVEQKKYPVELVERAGLVVPRKTGDGYYDRFRDRLIIPIHDLQGRVVGFGGRTLTDEQPKYLNSPETELFDKGKLLFALDKARAAIAKQDQAVIVEGYFDVIALHNAGITNVVASMGTALSSAQVRQLLRYTESKQIVLNFDADVAGNQAAERAVTEVENLAYRGDIRLRVLNIPDGKDPDDFLRNHPAADYHTLLKAAPLWLDWQIERAIAGHNLDNASEFQQVVQKIVDLLSNIANSSLRTHYVAKCGQLLGNGDNRLTNLYSENLLVQVRRKRRHETGKPEITSSSAAESLQEAEGILLRVYLHFPEYRQEVVSLLEERDLQFSFSHHRFLWKQILDLAESNAVGDENQSRQFDFPNLADGARSPDAQTAIAGKPRQPDLISLLQDHCTEFSKEMALVNHLFNLDEKTERDILRPALAIRRAVTRMERVICEKRHRLFLEQWKDIDVSTEPEQGLYLQKKIIVENARLKELDQELSTLVADLIRYPLVSFRSDD